MSIVSDELLIMVNTLPPAWVALRVLAGVGLISIGFIIGRIILEKFGVPLVTLTEFVGYTFAVISVGVVGWVLYAFMFGW